MTILEKVKRLRHETGASIKACKIAIENHKDILLKKHKEKMEIVKRYDKWN